MLSEAIPFFNGRLFLQLTPFSIFNVQRYIIDLFLIIASFLVFISNLFYFTKHLLKIIIFIFHVIIICSTNLFPTYNLHFPVRDASLVLNYMDLILR